MEWSTPIVTSHCFIGGKCIDDGALKSSDPSMKCDVASSTSAYTEVKGYMVSPALAQRPPPAHPSLTSAAFAVRSWTWLLSLEAVST